MKKKIFIIEDDANILFSLQAKLSVSGFEVEAHSGNADAQEIIEKIKNNKSDFVILDIILPKLNGFDLIKKINSEKELQETNIFVFTNMSDKESMDNKETLGLKYYFIKDDFSIDDFVEKIKRIINNLEKI